MSNSDGDLLVLHVDPSNNSVTIMFLNPVSAGHQIHLAKTPDYSAFTWVASEDMPARSTLTIEYDASTGTLVAGTGSFTSQSDVAEIPGDSFTLWYNAGAWNVTGGFDQRDDTTGGAYTWNSVGTSDPIVDLPAPADGMDWAFFPDLSATNADIKAAYESGATSGNSYWAQVEDGYDYSLGAVPATNTAPTGTGLPSDVTVFEDIASVVNLSALTLEDAEDDVLTLKLTPSAGTLSAGSTGGVTASLDEDGVSILLDGTPAALNAYLDGSNLTYTGPANVNGNDAATITASVTDGTETTALGSVNVDLVAQNDPPTLTGSVPDLTVIEDGAGTPDLSDLTVGDVDGDILYANIIASNGTLSADADVVSASGVTLGAEGSAVTVSGTASQINAFFAANGTEFRPFPDWTDPAAITVNVSDTALVSPNVQFDVEITPENDAPEFSGLPDVVEGVEDVRLTLDLSGLSVSDIEGDSLTLTLTTDAGRLVAYSAPGIFNTQSGDEKTVTVTGSAAALNAYFDTANVRYFPDQDDAGEDVAAITASLSDGDLTVPMGTIAVNLEPDNDAPVITGVPENFAAVLEEPTSLDLSDVEVSDVDSAEVTVLIGALNATLTAPADETIVIDSAFEDLEFEEGPNSFATFLSLTGSPEAITAYLDTIPIGYTAADLYEPTFEPSFGGGFHGGGLNNFGEEPLIPVFLEEPGEEDLPPPYFFYEGMYLPTGQMIIEVDDGETSGNFNEIYVDLTAPETAPQAKNFPGDQLVVEDVASALDLGRLAIFDRNDDVMTVTFTASSGTLTMDREEPEFLFALGGEEAGPTNVVSIEGYTEDILGALAFDSLMFQTDPNSTDPVTITVEATDGTATVTLGTIDVSVEAVDDPASLAADSFDTLDTDVLEGDLFADNGSGEDVDIDSDLAVTTVNGQDLATFNLAALSAGSGLTVNADGTFSFHAGGPSDMLVAASTGASNTTRMESFSYGTADGAEAEVEIMVHGTATSGLLLGTEGVDDITGGAGRNIVRGGAGADMMDGGDGDQDWLDYRGSNEGVRVNLEAGAASGGHAEGDSFTGFERMVGSSYGDTLIGDEGHNAIRGGSGNDTIVAGGGNDVLRGDGGADFLDGGDGIDTADYSGETERMRVDMRGVATGALGGDEDTLLNVERVVAGAGSDTLIGDDHDNALKGGAGRDSLIGGDGRDVLVGGTGGDKLRGDLGADVLIGGADDDTFVFRRVQDSNLTHGVDQIRDFVSGEDLVQLDFVADIAAAFIGDAAFSGTGVAELRLRDTGDHLQLLGDINGDGRDEFRLTFLNTETLSLNDFA